MVVKATDHAQPIADYEVGGIGLLKRGRKSLPEISKRATEKTADDSFNRHPLWPGAKRNM